MTDVKKSRKLVLIIIIVLVVLAVGINLVRVYIVKNAMEQGKNAYDKDDYDPAITNYNRAIKFCLWDKENKADSFLWRGRSYYEKEEYEQALEDFTEAIELQRDDYPYYTWRARTHHKMSNYRLAIADFSKSIELIELNGYDSWNTYLERADSYSADEEYNLKINDYNLAILALDKKINSPYISDDRIDELKEKRNSVIEKKRSTEKFIEWKKKNPEGTFEQWWYLELLKWLNS